MMKQREYTVIACCRDDLRSIERELKNESCCEHVPDRCVRVCNPRMGSRIQTHFMLTDQEAQQLKKDPRVRTVEIPVEQRTDIEIGLSSVQRERFHRSSSFDDTTVNWGLVRCNKKQNVYSNSISATDVFEYAMTGKNVDVVIQDSGIEPDHPEWQDANGVSRLKRINWYTESGLTGTQHANHYRDNDGHGTHVASTAVGRTYGWAKEANIYSQKLAGLEGSGDSGTGISISDAFDTIRLWHRAKNNTRPTVVNMSWGYSTSRSSDPTVGTYRGTAWQYGLDYTTATELWENIGVVPTLGGVRRIPVRVESVDAEIDDMIQDGIHVVIAAGNDYYKGDVSSGADYDNTVEFTGSTTPVYYHRGSSPSSDQAYIVGNIDSDVSLSGSDYLDKPSSSSSRGPRCNIWAPGTDIVAATSNTNSYPGSITSEYPASSAYKIAQLTGTSMAAPQIAGQLALHLQAFPEASPAQLMSRVLSDTQPVIYNTGSDVDYENYETSLLGSPNTMMWNRYGRQKMQITNTTDLINIT